jgi:hypothetical protein
MTQNNTVQICTGRQEDDREQQGRNQKVRYVGMKKSINPCKTEMMLDDDDTSGYCYKFYLEHFQTAKTGAFIISVL